MTTTATAAITTRPAMTLIGRCKACRAGARVVAVPTEERVAGPGSRITRYSFEAAGQELRMVTLNTFSDGAWARCRCTRWARLKPLVGRLNAAKRCNARCENATGHACECSCGGANHGSSHA